MSWWSKRRERIERESEEHVRRWDAIDRAQAAESRARLIRDYTTPLNASDLMGTCVPPTRIGADGKTYRAFMGTISTDDIRLLQDLGVIQPTAQPWPEHDPED